MALAYQELVDFIAAGCTPEQVVSYQPSESVRQRAFELIEKEKAGDITAEDQAELEHFMQLEHVMRLAKAKAKRHLSRDGAA